MHSLKVFFWAMTRCSVGLGRSVSLDSNSSNILYLEQLFMSINHDLFKYKNRLQ